MQQRWDDLDKLIMDSAPEIEVDSNYNSKLLSRINDKKPSKISNFAAGYSLIMAGLMLAFIYTSNMESAILEMKYKVETQILILKTNYNLNKYL